MLNTATKPEDGNLGALAGEAAYARGKEDAWTEIGAVESASGIAGTGYFVRDGDGAMLAVLDDLAAVACYFTGRGAAVGDEDPADALDEGHAPVNLARRLLGVRAIAAEAELNAGGDALVKATIPVHEGMETAKATIGEFETRRDARRRRAERDGRPLDQHDAPAVGSWLDSDPDDWIEPEAVTVNLARRLASSGAVNLQIEPNGIGNLKATFVVAFAPVDSLETAQAVQAEFEARRRRASGEHRRVQIDTIKQAREFGRANFGRLLTWRKDPDSRFRHIIGTTGEDAQDLASVFGEELSRIALQAAHPEGAGS